MNGDPDAFLGRLRQHLIDAKAPYMIVGSTAAAWLGSAVNTVDVDVVIQPTPLQLSTLIRSLQREGFYCDEESALDALRRESMVNAIEPETGWKVDLIFLGSDDYNQEAFSRRLEVDSSAGRFITQTPEDLILSKLVWRQESQSEKQLRDVIGVFDIWRSKLDAEYLQRWADELGVRKELDELYLRQEPKK
jgi:hypothetical protein